MTLGLDNIENNYSALFELISERKEQVLEFKDFIEKETSWLTSPASTRFHLNIEKGLLHRIKKPLKKPPICQY